MICTNYGCHMVAKVAKIHTPRGFHFDLRRLAVTAREGRVERFSSVGGARKKKKRNTLHNKHNGAPGRHRCNLEAML